MIQPLKQGTSRAWRIAVGAVQAVFLLTNLWAFLASASRRQSVTHPLWGLSPSRIHAVQRMATFEMAGRLCFVVAAICLLVLLARRNRRWPGFAFWCVLVFLIFEATLRSHVFFWGDFVVDATVVAEWIRAAIYGALGIGFLVHVRSRWVRAIFEPDVVATLRSVPPAPTPIEAIAMPQPADVGSGGASPTLLLGVHTTFLLVNLMALLEGFNRHRNGDHATWGQENEAFTAIQSMDQYEIFGRLAILWVGFYLLEMIARRDRQLPKLYRIYSVISLIFLATLIVTHSHWDTLARGSSLVFHWSGTLAFGAPIVLGLLQLSQLSGARSPFVRAPIPAGAPQRLAIGIVAIALICWPFLVNMGTDVSAALAGYIAPTAASEGDGAAFALLISSLIGGVFLLMKHTWRMKTVWIAILCPLSAAVLAFAYFMMSFGLYYRF